MTKNPTYDIAKGLSLNSDMALRVKMSKDRSLDKRLPQLGKGLFSIRS